MQTLKVNDSVTNYRVPGLAEFPVSTRPMPVRLSSSLSLLLLP